MYKRKTIDIYVIQSDYGYGHGFEDVCTEETRTEGKKRLHEYYENERPYRHRMIKRREKINA